MKRETRDAGSLGLSRLLSRGRKGQGCRAPICTQALLSQAMTTLQAKTCPNPHGASFSQKGFQTKGTVRWLEQRYRSQAQWNLKRRPSAGGEASS